MLLLSHIFSRICCPVEITTGMCVQPGWQPAGCPPPRFSVSPWGAGVGCPRDPRVGVARWRGRGLVWTGGRAGCVSAPTPILWGLGLVITPRTVLCRAALPLNAPQGVRVPQVWESLPQHPLLCDPRCTRIRRPRVFNPARASPSFRPRTHKPILHGVTRSSYTRGPHTF